MHHRPTLAALLLALTRLGATSAATGLPRDPHQPSPTSCTVAGAWLGNATDRDGTRWTFPMQFGQAGTAVDVSIEWHGSNGHGGTERAQGLLDCGTRRLELHTITVSGGLAPGLYHATLSPDARTLTGSWDGPAVVPAQWTAAKQ